MTNEQIEIELNLIFESGVNQIRIKKLIDKVKHTSDNEIIGELYTSNLSLKDSQARRNMWLFEAKKRCEVNDAISFDRVFEMLLKTKQACELLKSAIEFMANEENANYVITTQDIELLKSALELPS